MCPVVSVTVPLPTRLTLWAWRGREEGAGTRSRKPSGSRSKRGMQVQQLHLFAVGKVVFFSLTQGAEAGGFVISAELALGCLPQATAAMSASTCCLQGGELA